MTSMVDWDFAVEPGLPRLAGDGPEVTAAEAAAAVTELRADADRSTGAGARLHRPGGARATPPPCWSSTGAAGCRPTPTASRGSSTPSWPRLTEKKGPPTGCRHGHRLPGHRRRGGPDAGLPRHQGARPVRPLPRPRRDAPATDTVACCSWRPTSSTSSASSASTRTDFRLWVCLHEETHRVQFTAVPWMRDHLYAEMQALTDTVEPSRMMDDVVRRVSEAVRGGGGSLLDVMGTPGAEGDPRPDHRRDVAARGPRRRGDGRRRSQRDPERRRGSARSFDERRKGVGTLDRILRRLLGLDAKMAQYRDGAAFVRHVVDKVGMDDFNAVWAEPAHLPSKSEIGDPDAWITRVPVSRSTPRSPPYAAAVRGVLADLRRGADRRGGLQRGRRLAGAAERRGLRGAQARPSGWSA